MVKGNGFVISVLCGLVLFGFASACFADAAASLEQAQQYVKDADYQQAETVYKAILAADPNTDDAFAAQEKLTVLYVTWGRHAQADAAYQRLLADYSGLPGIAKAVDHVADEYRQAGNYKTARKFYRHIVANWPQAEHAAEAQRAVVLTSMLLGEGAEAEIAIEELLTKFEQHQNIATAVDHLADDLRELGKYSRARDLYQHVVSHWPQDERSIGAQGGVARANILLGAEGAAQKAIDRLTADFSTDPRLPKVLYEIAQEYEKAKKFDEAQGVYQLVAEQHPETKYGMKGQLDAHKAGILSLVESQDDSEVQTALDGLVVDFAGHEYLPTVVYKIAVQYHVKAYSLRGKGFAYRDQAAECFEKAATIFDRVIEEFPGSDAAPRACSSGGDCYRKVGRYEESIRCYQKVLDDHPDFEKAWKALFQIGLSYEDLKKTEAIDESEADTKTKAVYEQLLEKHPSCHGADHARQWLSRYNSN
ncbi:MAG: tetratricopeptide repeat protein [Planctomycetota bacterium]|jgi:tetratricopeptide (TPR) repeat protein